MAKMIINGEVCSGSNSYASAVEYIKEDGSKTTVQNEIDELQENISVNKLDIIRFNDGINHFDYTEIYEVNGFLILNLFLKVSADLLAATNNTVIGQITDSKYFPTRTVREIAICEKDGTPLKFEINQDGIVKIGAYASAYTITANSYARVCTVIYKLK